MKDETTGVPMEIFVRQLWILNEKGINENVADDELRYEDYKNVLLIKSYMRHKMNRIQSNDHNIGSNWINNFFVFLRW